jgi:pyruvate kinase
MAFLHKYYMKWVKADLNILKFVLMKDIDTLTEDLLAIRQEILEGQKEYQEVIDQVHPNYRYSATNFIRYLKLRTIDLRKIQFRLSALGLSSISHSERHVLANVENILYFLYMSQGKTFQGKYPLGAHPVNFLESQKVLKKNTKRLLKTQKNARRTAIMVTLSDKATDYKHIKELILAGMEIARINCSHDSQEVWQTMVGNVRSAVQETGMRCSVYFDLAGPKLRTATVKSISKKAYILLHPGDVLHLYREESLEKMPEFIPSEKVPAVSCAIPQIFEDTRKGDSIWFDDGKIGGLIEDIHKNHLIVKITKTNPKGGKLREEKGINLPETNLNLPSLTKEDIDNLPFVAEHADIVGFSFVRKPQDVRLLQEELEKLNRSDVGLVLKIENKEAFNNLPALILQGMKSPTLGVMTARGDLAVELGAERLSEVQEQILWLCEAALIPNIWATQVLETLAKKGIAARAEITDAAMSARSECVMLNKGDHILDAVKTLVNILERMEKHQYKKQGTLRLLKVAERFFMSPTQRSIP